MVLENAACRNVGSRGRWHFDREKVHPEIMLNSIPAVKGEVQTVLGAISAQELGVTMVHEHLLIDLTCLFQNPEEAGERARSREPVSLANLAWVRRNWNSSLDNLRLDNEALAIEEAMQLKLAGGGSLVEVSNIGLARDPAGLQRISRATGLNVVMGSGYYVDVAHPAGMDDKSEEDIEAEIVNDITQGVGPFSVRAGIIGELGCSSPLTKNEIKVLRAGARAQQRTGAAISIHIGRDPHSPVDIANCLEAAGADLSRVVLGHMDRIAHPMPILTELASRGCSIAFDTFGQETWVYPFNPSDRLSDVQRVDILVSLIEAGFGDKLMVSHDVGYKHRLDKYGGCGYAHILTTVVPHHMRRKGITEQQLQAILVNNPARMLAFE